jgi:hypothetical protein
MGNKPAFPATAVVATVAKMPILRRRKYQAQNPNKNRDFCEFSL